MPTVEPVDASAGDHPARLRGSRPKIPRSSPRSRSAMDDNRWGRGCTYTVNVQAKLQAINEIDAARTTRRQGPVLRAGSPCSPGALEALGRVVPHGDRLRDLSCRRARARPRRPRCPPGRKLLSPSRRSAATTRGSRPDPDSWIIGVSTMPGQHAVHANPMALGERRAGLGEVHDAGLRRRVDGLRR